MELKYTPQNEMNLKIEIVPYSVYSRMVICWPHDHGDSGVFFGTPHLINLQFFSYTIPISEKS